MGLQLLKNTNLEFWGDYSRKRDDRLSIGDRVKIRWKECELIHEDENYQYFREVDKLNHKKYCTHPFEACSQCYDEFKEWQNE